MNKIWKKLKIALVFLIIFANITFSVPNTVFGEIIDSPAGACVVMDAKTGIILLEKDKNVPLYPASITKIMTTLLALEYIGDDEAKYDELITISRDAVYTLIPNSSKIGINIGEKISMRDALFAVMLPSANEVSNAVAEHIAGSIESFSERMTERAKELGAQNTTFMNPHGLPDDDHITSAYDMALIMQEAVKHPFFRELIQTKYHQIEKGATTSQMYPCSNSNKLIRDNSEFYDPRVVGSKTGYTDSARHTLVTFAKEDDMELIVVTLKCDKNVPFTETKRLLDIGFGMFHKLTFFDQPIIGETTGVQMYQGTPYIIHPFPLVAKNVTTLTMPQSVSKEDFRELVNIPKGVPLPVRQGDVLGVVTLSYKGTEIAKSDVIAKDSMMERTEAELRLLYPDLPKAETDLLALSETEMPTEAVKKEAATSLTTVAIGAVLILMAILGALLVVLRFIQLRRYKRNRLKKSSFGYLDRNRHMRF